MKLQPHSVPLLGLLLLSPTALAVFSDPASAGSPDIIARDSASNSPLIQIARESLRKRTAIDNAPVDGKDGKPHQGPFVETNGSEESSSSPPSEDNSELTLSKDRPIDTTIDEYGNKIPQSNDGVMADKERSRAKKGTTGTEGGVSERERQRKAEEEKTGEKSEGSPIPPEERPPLPHSEEAKMKAEGYKSEDFDQESKSVETEHDTIGLEKPENLPDMPHDKSELPLPESAIKDHLGLTSVSGSESDYGTSESPPISGIDNGDSAGVITPFHSFFLSFTMIIFSEIGDKTFLVAALMAMKHDRMVVFSAAFGALIAMTVLSAVLGHAVPTLIPKSLTNFAAAGLFLIFGVKLLREGMAMSPDEGVAEEMHEVEREISEKESEALRNGGRASVYAMEAGYAGQNRKPRSRSRLNSPPRSPSSSPEGKANGIGRGGGQSSLVKGSLDGIHNLASLLLSPAWVQTFVMTFLGEWGDRSQIATIAMAAGQDYWWVTLGAVIGHGCCTGLAVIGGRAIAGKVSMKVVTIGGACAFIVFGFIYLAEGFYA